MTRSDKGITITTWILKYLSQYPTVKFKVDISLWNPSWRRLLKKQSKC
jgi:hypothetical protein